MLIEHQSGDEGSFELPQDERDEHIGQQLNQH